MAVYNLQRFKLLLVEDNGYVRRILENILRDFQFGQITACANGQEAIKFIKDMRDNPETAGAIGLDLVITDLLMAPINGLLLARWLRTAKESPNRFVPIIMLSGAADSEYVNSARDLGATEFLGKPFSVETVYKHILEIINYPRKFIATANYFGPDRRRKQTGPLGKEMRKTRQEDITTVYSAAKAVKPKKGSADVWHFRLPNRLKEMAAGGMGGGEPGEMPANLLEDAEANLERTALDFTDWASNYLSQLAQLCAEALTKEGSRNTYFEQINLLAHELRGQGGTFGYPLITIFGKMLYECTGKGCREDDNAVDIVKAHIDAMRAVLREKIGDDGGEVGRALMGMLKEAVEKNAAAD